MDEKDIFEEVPLKYVHGVLKVGAREHLQLLQEGKLWFRSLEYFVKNYNSKEPHNDPHEGLGFVFQPDQVQVTVTPTGQSPHILKDLVGPILGRFHKECSIFCMFGLISNDWSKGQVTEETKNEFITHIGLREAIKGFGNSYMVILNFQEFADRIKVACKREGITLRARQVTYISENSFNGKIPEELVGFVKLDNMRDQREFRFMVGRNELLPDPYILDIGSIADISIIAPLDNFDLSVKLADY